MPEASQFKARDFRLLTLANAISAGEIYQMADGRAAFYSGATAVSGSGQVEMQLFGPVNVYKTTGITFLDGQEVWWDHSANKAIDYPGDHRDFLIGTAIADADNPAITMFVDLNAKVNWLIDTSRDGFLHVPVAAAGAPYLRQVGGWHKLVLAATNEAEKLDLLSIRGFDTESNWIAEFDILVIDDGASSAVDFNVGVANETNATNADTIAQSCFFHLDGNDLNLFAESDDSSTDVAATDTTYDIVLGTVTRLMLDGRDHTNVAYYVDGDEVLSGTANLGMMTAAAGPLKLLIHLEKSAATDVYDAYVRGRVRTMEQ